MAKYIHVITATKTPDILSASWDDPFGDFATDPNVGGFGAGERTMWLPVDEPARPSDTPAERYAESYTDDTDGNRTRGVYVPGEELWRFTWDAVARTLDEAKAYQLGQLRNDYEARLGQGFLDDGPGASGKIFALSEIDFGVIIHKKAWYDDALASGVIPAGRKASVFAADRTRVQYNNFNKFNDFVDAYGLVFDDINEHYYVKADDINAATSVGQVANVTWDFDAL